MPWAGRRGENEAGLPWDEDFSRINPAYFDLADLRIHHLVASGLLPCVVACWGYFLVAMGAERMKRHWRHLVARYGTYPVAWCLAGEASMPFYLSEDREREQKAQISGWTEMAAYLKDIDPFHHPITIHPSEGSRTEVDDVTDLDFVMLQTGHVERLALPNTLRLVSGERAATPTMPVIDGEVCYEGIADASRQEVQRYLFWMCMLSGAAGHSYGANGVWQVNGRDEPYGRSPGGQSWGDTPWQDAAQLPGSRQLGFSKRLLERYRWWLFEPHPEWVKYPATVADVYGAYAAGVPGEVRFIFVRVEPIPGWSERWPLQVNGLEAGVAYRAFMFNPVNGQEYGLGAVQPDPDGRWRPDLPRPPYFQDWVVVLEAQP